MFAHCEVNEENLPNFFSKASSRNAISIRSSFLKSDTDITGGSWEVAAAKEEEEEEEEEDEEEEEEVDTDAAFT